MKKSLLYAARMVGGETAELAERINEHYNDAEWDRMVRAFFVSHLRYKVREAMGCDELSERRPNRIRMMYSDRHPFVGCHGYMEVMENM